MSFSRSSLFAALAIFVPVALTAAPAAYAQTASDAPKTDNMSSDTSKSTTHKSSHKPHHNRHSTKTPSTKKPATPAS